LRLCFAWPHPLFSAREKKQKGTKPHPPPPSTPLRGLGNVVWCLFSRHARMWVDRWQGRTGGRTAARLTDKAPGFGSGSRRSWSCSGSRRRGVGGSACVGGGGGGNPPPRRCLRGSARRPRGSAKGRTASGWYPPPNEFRRNI